jgi:hypothetical protein
VMEGGTGELFDAVVGALTEAGVEALPVQLESATLEDASSGALTRLRHAASCPAGAVSARSG